MTAPLLRIFWYECFLWIKILYKNLVGFAPHKPRNTFYILSNILTTPVRRGGGAVRKYGNQQSKSRKIAFKIVFNNKKNLKKVRGCGIFFRNFGGGADFFLKFWRGCGISFGILEGVRIFSDSGGVAEFFSHFQNFTPSTAPALQKTNP